MAVAPHLQPTLPTDPGVTSANPRQVAIWAQDVSRKFGDEVAVSELNMTVPYGKIFGFIGPSGSGKTTTIRLLTGVLRPTSGELSVLGAAPWRFNQSMREKLGYMPQQFVLYSNLSVMENLNFTASLYGMPLRRGRQLREALDFVELTDHSHKVARDISGGMQRRLSLAATLVHDPELIFLDEPTAGIDPILREKFWEHFRSLQARGRTLFITTQYVSEAAYCDFVGVIANGRLVVVDTPDGLRKRALGGEILHVRTAQPMDVQSYWAMQQLPYVQGRVRGLSDSEFELTVGEASTDMPQFMSWAETKGITIQAIEEYNPPFDDVFVRLVKGESAHA
jgi:ABC-2 type transport system ATP-binding protein